MGRGADGAGWVAQGQQHLDRGSQQGQLAAHPTILAVGWGGLVPDFQAAGLARCGEVREWPNRTHC